MTFTLGIIVGAGVFYVLAKFVPGFAKLVKLV